MKIKKAETKIKPDIKIDIPSDTEQFDLRTLDTNIIVDFLEEQIKLREQPLKEHLKNQLKK